MVHNARINQLEANSQMKKILIVLVIFIALIFVFFLVKKKSVSPISQIIPKTNQKTSEQAQSETGLKIPNDFSAKIFSEKITNARNLEFSPGGVLLVSQPSQGKITALPDKKTVISNLKNPHGFAFFGGKLYIAEETRVSVYNWDESEKKATFEKKLFDLPKGARHTTRTITFANDGKMYISIGSSCDVCFEQSEQLASIIVSNAQGEAPKVFAKGLRNAVFTAIDPKTQKLWSTEMGRDFLGDNLPPDEVNLIEQDKDYGWPVCYGDKIHDTVFDKRQLQKNPCEETTAPQYQISAHSAPLGLAFVDSKEFPQDWQGDLLVSYHGSWNSTTPKGYKIVRIKMKDGKPQGEEDFITGFLKDGQVEARPVDLIFDKEGSLFVSDDKSGTIFKIDKQN